MIKRQEKLRTPREEQDPQRLRVSRIVIRVTGFPTEAA